MSHMTPHKTWALLVGPIAAGAAAGGLAVAGFPSAACWCAAVTVLCGVWWILEPIAIPATSLVPFATFPLLGVLDDQEVAACYGHPVILLVIGGLLLSSAMEKSGAHRRVALGVVGAFGGGGERGVVLGFLLASSMISMWMSNTATTLILLPVAVAVLEQSEVRTRLTAPLLLSVAYGASIGGIGTPVGSATNLMFMAAYRETTGIEIGFLGWMKLGVPVVILLVPATGYCLTRGLDRQARFHLPHLGAWQPPERRVLIVFALTALAWTTRTDPWGGWSRLLDTPGVGDGTVALLAAAAMFVLPDGHGGRLLDWGAAAKIPWGILLLLGGGIAIARGFASSGLSETLAGLLTHLGGLPVLPMIALTCTIVTMLTEVTSNTATTALLMPILAATGTAAGIDPALLMAPAVISASCAFMLPVATSPNAIVFSAGSFSVGRMATEGFMIKLIGIPVVTAVCYLFLSH